MDGKEKEGSLRKTEKGQEKKRGQGRERIGGKLRKMKAEVGKKEEAREKRRNKMPKPVHRVVRHVIGLGIYWAQAFRCFPVTDAVRRYVPSLASAAAAEQLPM